jgi:hypothetical protein
MLTNRVPLGSRKAVSVASGTSSWANAPFSFGLSGAKKHQVDAEDNRATVQRRACQCSMQGAGHFVSHEQFC